MEFDAPLAPELAAVLESLGLRPCFGPALTGWHSGGAFGACTSDLVVAQSRRHACWETRRPGRVRFVRTDARCGGARLRIGCE